MINNRIAKLIYRLISGRQIYRLASGLEVEFTPPTLDTLGRAEFYWQDHVNSVKFNEWPTLEQAPQIAIELGLWSREEEGELNMIKDKIKESKDIMYDNYMLGKTYKHFSAILATLRSKQTDLISKRHSMDYITIEGWANSVKNEMIVFDSINIDGALTTPERRELISLINSDNITESEYRQIVRDSTWMSYWAISKESMFSNKLGELNFEQRNMCNIARLYDNAYSSPECPEEEVLNDPDLFDGWMAAKEKKRESDKIKREIDSKVDSNAKHVFVMSNERMTPEKINQMNSAKGIQEMKELTNVK